MVLRADTGHRSDFLRAEADKSNEFSTHEDKDINYWNKGRPTTMEAEVAQREPPEENVPSTNYSHEPTISNDEKERPSWCKVMIKKQKYIADCINSVDIVALRLYKKDILPETTCLNVVQNHTKLGLSSAAYELLEFLYHDPDESHHMTFYRILEDTGQKKLAQFLRNETGLEPILSWQEFTEKMRKHLSLFDRSLKHFGRTATHYTVRVVDGSKDRVLNIIRNKITPHTDNIEIEEIVDIPATTTFFGGKGQSRVICKSIKSGMKIFNVATEDYTKLREACLQSEVGGMLTLLMENTEHKYYGITAGHVLIENFEPNRLTSELFHCKCSKRTVVCNVEYQDPGCQSQSKTQVLAREVFVGVETFDEGFMDCAWFEVDDTNNEYLDFRLENTGNLPTIFRGESLLGKNVCSINTFESSSVDGVIIMDAATWILRTGEVICIFDVFMIQGNDGYFARAGNSGGAVYDKDGNVFGMIIAYDSSMPQLYPYGIAICIRLDRMVDYIAKIGGLKLEVARQPANTSSSGKTESPDQSSNWSTSGASSSYTDPPDQSSSGSTSSAHADTIGKERL